MHKKSFDPPASAFRQAPASQLIGRGVTLVMTTVCRFVVASIVYRSILPDFEKVLSNLRRLRHAASGQTYRSSTGPSAISPFRESFREAASAACTMMVAPSRSARPLISMHAGVPIAM
jgi:hypothetical protein